MFKEVFKRYNNTKHMGCYSQAFTTKAGKDFFRMSTEDDSLIGWANDQLEPVVDPETAKELEDAYELLPPKRKRL